MSDLGCVIGGIESVNPFWLASAPPTDKKYTVERGFKAGWGGAVWKTLGVDPPIVNVTSRYGVHRSHDRSIVGINNIELISDRPLGVNLREIEELRREWPDRVIVGSIMAPIEEAAWKNLAIKVANAGVHGIELNLGCPHGMCERGMGSAVGQVPDLVTKTTAWVREATGLPVFTKLTPNVTDILVPATAAKAGGADAVSLINTLNSIISVDLDLMAPAPTVDGKGTHGGYCGEAVKPVALHMVAEIMRAAETEGLEVSAIGGISTWRDAAEFIALGASGVQVCTAAMLYGFR
ncbi:MAG: NAD-dependent dihydropyrimidine dehydrogenase subunit PreA, partial [Parvularculaceae bacterium]